MPVAYMVVRIAGLKESSSRAIVFLDGDDCEALGAFSNLSQNRERDVRNRFVYWIDGNTGDKYFHGWSDDRYKECFSFRWKEKKVHCRLYGFLCHPRADPPRSDRRFQVCVLTGYDRKTTENTDFTILDVANRLNNDPHIKKILKAAFNT